MPSTSTMKTKKEINGIEDREIEKVSERWREREREIEKVRERECEREREGERVEKYSEN